MVDPRNLEKVLMAVAMGDEAAIQAFAQYLAGQGQQSAQQIEANIRAHYAGKDQFRTKVAALAKEYPVLDKHLDPEGWEAACKEDARLKQKHPELSDEERIARVAERVSARLGEPEERDHGKAIANMRKSRQHDPDEADGADMVFEADPIGDELRSEERLRSQAVSEMIKERQELREQGARRAGEQTERPKAKRAFPFPAR